MLRLSLGAISAIVGLPRTPRKEVRKFLRMLDHERPAPSLNLERLVGSGLLSARLDQGYRGILEEHEDGLTLIHIDRHDDAYRWAERRVDSGGRTPGLELDTKRARRIGPDPVPDGRTSEVHRTYAPVEAAVDPVANLRVGYILTWDDLVRRFRWDTDSYGFYLREKDGEIVCACLRADMNPNAPWEILVGTKLANIRQAELLSKQSTPIPVFVKEQVNQWEYWGMFRLDRYETDRASFQGDLPPRRAADTSGVLHLVDADAD